MGLIDVDVAMNAFLDECMDEYAKYFSCHDIDRVLDTVPKVDAVPVVHGRYQKSEDKDEWYSYEYTCLKCGATMMVADADGNDVEPGFCAVCGTLLDGGAEDG